MPNVVMHITHLLSFDNHKTIERAMNHKVPTPNDEKESSRTQWN